MRNVFGEEENNFIPYLLFEYFKRIKFMEELYKFVNIPNFREVQTELLNAIDYDYQSKGKHAKNYTAGYMKLKCPTLMNWLNGKNKSHYRLLRFYFTPPNGALEHHIDGNTPTVPFGLNIPVINCENTSMTWWNCDEDNFRIPNPDNGYLGAITPKDLSKITVKDKLELIKPCFTRNNIMHSIENPNNTTRIMFTVRWGLHPTKFRTIDEVMDTTDLFA